MCYLYSHVNKKVHPLSVLWFYVSIIWSLGGLNGINITADEQQYMANTAYQHQHLIPAINSGGRSMMIWACFEASGPGYLAVTETIKNPLHTKNLSINCIK